MANERNWHLAGWVLFILCALLYIASSLRSGDMLSFTGSVVFFVACFVFLVPLLRQSKND